VSFDRQLRAARRWPVDHPAWAYDRKLAGRALAASLGLRVPELLSGPGDLDTLRPPTRPAALKPDAGSGGHGVLLLRPDQEGWRLPDGVVLDWVGVLDRARQAQQRRAAARLHDRIAGPWMVEESATADGSPPVSYRVWTFRGGVELVTAGCNPNVAGGDKRVHAWDPRDGWAPVRPWLPNAKVVDPSLPPPRHGGEMVDAAGKVLAAVGVPFLRVDFYDGPFGPLFGEITPVPTWARTRHTPYWDQRMGAAWTSPA